MSDRAAGNESDDGQNSDNNGPPQKRKRFIKSRVGVDMPFSHAQRDLVQTQFLRANVSANLPFRWTLNPDVIKLFLMFRSTATDVMPTAKVISGRLLDKEEVKLRKKMVKALKGKCGTASLGSSDGWRDKYSVTGVDVTVAERYVIPNESFFCEALSRHSVI
ncbi:hypothetical protein B0H14DRAFT_2602864 [Mycena olivaceomarginata]|nr:hypothetical protein B0H14DRAFT_2602864 [Mycena olivaceomarginata]